MIATLFLYFFFVSSVATVAVTKPDSSPDMLTDEVNETWKLVSNIQYQVSFLCFSKRVADTRKFTVIVECCDVKVLDAKRRIWKSQGYEEHPQKDAPVHTLVESKQAFKLVFYESAILRKDPKLIDLEFHRKRDNIAQFNVELKGKAIQCINGRLYIYAAQNVNNKNEEISEKEYLSSVDINLVLNLIEIGSVSSDRGGRARNDGTLSVKSVNVSSQSGSQSVSRADGRSARGSRNGKDVQTKRQDTEPKMDALKMVQASLEQAMKNIDPIEEKDSEPIQETDNEIQIAVSDNPSAG